jgi:hypothetical protein
VNWQDRFTEFLIRRRWPLLAATVVLTLIAWPISLRLKFDQSIESLYAPSNPRLQAFVRSKQTFGGDEFLIVAYHEARLFDERGALTEAAKERMEQLAQQMGELPGVDPNSIQHLAAAMRVPYGRARIRQFMEGVLVGADGETVAVVARLSPVDEAHAPRAATFRKVREIAKAHDPPAVVVGEPVQVHDMFRYVEEDGFTLGLWSTVLLMAMIYLLFRSVRWMLLPLAVVVSTLFLTEALLVLSGMQLSMVSSMLNSLVTIIVISTVAHLIVRFRDLSRHHDRERALFLALRQLVAPVFWMTATTAAGFAALQVCHVTPVASFGIMMALATMLLLVTSAGLLPGGVLLRRTTPVPATSALEAPTTAALMRLTEWVVHRPAMVWTVMIAVTLACLPGLFRLHVETDFSKNFRANSPIVQALNFFETHLGGAGTWEVNFPAPSELTEDYLEQVDALAKELNELTQRTTPDRLTKVISVTEGLSLIPRDVFFARLTLSTRLNLLDRIQPDFVPSLYNADAGRMRIVLRALERQPSEVKLKLIDDVERLARKRFPQAEATGLYVLLAYLVDSLMDDQLISSLIATAAMVVLMIIAFRNLWLSIILLAPNVFPLIVVIGAMGWLGMKINVGSAMIAAVSMGLTINSGILYIADYKAARERGLNFSDSLQETSQGVGLAVVLSNVALVVGFMVLTLSHFVPLIYFGVLVNVAMIGGLIGNLVLVPLLLRIVDRPTETEAATDEHGAARMATDEPVSKEAASSD